MLSQRKPKQRYFFLFIITLLSTNLNNVGFAAEPVNVGNKTFKVAIENTPFCLFSYQLAGSTAKISIKPPSFEIDGKLVLGSLTSVARQPIKTLTNGVKEYSFLGNLKSDPTIVMMMTFRVAPDNGTIRFRYNLSSNTFHRLTKNTGTDNIQYLTADLKTPSRFTEVRFSDYNDKYHSYILNEQSIKESAFQNQLSVMGPMLVAENKTNNESYLLAYEHGSQFPDEFLNFRLLKNHAITINGVRGNYVDGQPLDKQNSYETIWFELAGNKGNSDALATHYRNFALKYLSENSESRKPYLFYNTWGRQERVKWAGGKYLETMTLTQTLNEVDRAHEMGLEVFVIDAGWFVKTGDWKVNTGPLFFPDTLKQVLRKIQSKNMKLGLWFNPVVAAKSSAILARNLSTLSTWDDKPKGLTPIWETEESRSMCFVSKYWEDYANEMLKVISDLKISYVKWDAIDQYSCNDSKHYHGTATNSLNERADRYAFLLPVFLSKVVDKINKRYPEVIFDFDITENGRAVGLGFLSSGKYFAMNNGPYFHNFDLAEVWGSPLENKNANIFVQPGPARTWFTRSVLAYDKWLPSTLFLTHYQVDGNRASQRINIASMLLGQNGIWGEILKVKEDDVSWIGNQLATYKKVRESITLAQPVTTGSPGDFFEIHEKIHNGKGLVSIFGNGKGRYTYVTNGKVAADFAHEKNTIVKIDESGRAVITVEFEQADAALIWFGTGLKN